MPWHLSQQPCRYCGRRSASPWWGQAVLVLPHASGRKAACGLTEGACGPCALPQHQQPAQCTRHVRWQGTAKRCAGLERDVRDGNIQLRKWVLHYFSHKLGFCIFDHSIRSLVLWLLLLSCRAFHCCSLFTACTETSDCEICD